MRICILTYAPSGWGGTEANTLGVARALAEDGHAVTLVQIGHAAYAPHVTASDRIEVRQVTLSGSFGKAGFGWWRGLLSKLSPDICVLSKGGFEILNTGLDIAARARKGRYVLLEHHPARRLPARASQRHLGGIVPGIGLWWWRLYLPRWLHLKLAHRVITDSDFVTGILAEEFGLSRAKAFRVHPGVDPDKIGYRPDARRRLRDEWQISPDALLLGSVGRLDHVKGLDRTLRAFACVKRSNPGRQLRLVLAGEGPESAVLRQLASNLGVAADVVFPGRVREVADALSALDLYLMPSREEGFGIALIEAMACERVCIAMNSGGPNEILTDESIGWLTPADDESQFAQAVQSAVTLSEDDRRKMGRRARAHVVEQFCNRMQMQRIAALIVGA